MNIVVLSVGKKPRGAELELIEEYAKRIQKPWRVTWKFVPHEQGDPETAKKVESTALLYSTPDEFHAILLDERGKSVSNQQLVRLLNPDNATKDIVIIIGGAYGVDERVRMRANEVISLSELVFPHKLVRVMVAEQLYRTQAILQGHPYHHT